MEMDASAGKGWMGVREKTEERTGSSEREYIKAANYGQDLRLREHNKVAKQ